MESRGNDMHTALARTSGRQIITGMFRRLLPVQILLAAIGTINGIISGIYGSNFIGPAAMTAVGLYAPVTMFLQAAGTILLGGTQVVGGEYMGRGEAEGVNRVFSVDVVFTSVAGAVLGAMLIALAVPFSSLFGANEEAAVYLIPYLRGAGFGILPLLLSQQLSSFLSMEQKTRRTIMGSVLLIGLNAILGVLLVRVFRWGAFGLSFSSSLALWVFTVYLGWPYLMNRGVIRFQIKGMQLSDLGQVLHIGYPGGLSFGYQVIRGFILNAIALRYIGNDGVAALATYLTINALAWSLPAGILAAGRLLMSVSYGEEDRQSLTDVMRVVMFRYALIDLLFGIILGILANPIAHIYYQDPTSAVFQMTAMGIRIVVLAMPLNIITMMFVSWGQIADYKVLVHLLSVLDGVAVIAVSSRLLVPHMGMNGIWISYVVLGVVCVLTIVVYAAVRNRSFPRTMSELMVVPRSFGARDEERMDLTIKSAQEVARTAEAVQTFCQKRGIDEKRAYFAALCLEEMAGNVVEHGFRKDNKKHSVDIRVVHKEDDLILRIKDDCVMFDPAERASMTDPQDITKNIGIRMTYHIAKDISHRYLLGINVLTIRI